MRIAFLSSHPIQYQAPLFRALSQRRGVDFTALFCHNHGVRPSYDPEFQQTFQYDVPLLEGYEHRFLPNLARRPAVRAGSLINPSIVAILARGEFDALIVHGYASVTSNLAFATPRFRTRLLLRGESNLLVRPPRAKERLKRLVLWAIFHRLDHFVAIGSLNRAYYEAYGAPPERITLAPYSVDNAYFDERSREARRDRVAARMRLGLPDRGVLFISAAKLIAKKRPFDLLEAFARAGIAHIAGLVFVGSGQLAGELSARVEALRLREAVAILGFRNQSELPELLGASDAVVLPSDFEPWGLIVNEAMACGAAAIISDKVGAGPDLVADERVTFPAGDVERLASILRAVALDPVLLSALKGAAAVRIAGWGLEQCADGVIRGVEAALDRAPAG